MNDTSVSRRTLAKGVAWTTPAIALAASAPSLAASTAESCGGGLRESSGGSDVRRLGTLTGSNVGGAEYPFTLQTKPLYDCAAGQADGTVTSCEDASEPTSGPVSISFRFNNSDFERSPQSRWKLAEDWVNPKWTIDSVVDDGTTTTITFSYPSIARYQSSGQIQVPMKRVPGTNGTISSSTTSGCVYNVGVWNTVPVG